MKNPFRLFLLFAGLLFLTLQSCVDDDYDFDKMDKNAEFSIPPVPLGALDTIYVGSLAEYINTIDSLIPGGSGAFVTAYSDTVRGLFNDDVNSRFFYDGAGNVMLQTDVDMHLMSPFEALEAKVGFNVLDEDGNAIENVKIPAVSLSYGENKGKQIVFGEQYMKYMKNASGLALTIVLRANSVHLASDDYLLFSNIVLKTGGISFEF